MELTDMRRVTVVLPSYNPDEKLQKTVASLLAVGFTDLVVVNDGSRADTEKTNISQCCGTPSTAARAPR